MTPSSQEMESPGIPGRFRAAGRQLHRYVRTAMLFRDLEILHRDDRPMLYDVHIVAMSPQTFTLAGFERVNGADYAQSWLVQLSE
jgi:hypothetical protein